MISSEDFQFPPPRRRTPENGRSYSEEMLRKAMKKVWYKKMGLREAARVYNIPPSTLQQKLKALRLKQQRARQKSGSQEEENEPKVKRARRESRSKTESGTESDGEAEEDAEEEQEEEEEHEEEGEKEEKVEEAEEAEEEADEEEEDYQENESHEESEVGKEESSDKGEQEEADALGPVSTHADQGEQEEELKVEPEEEPPVDSYVPRKPLLKSKAKEAKDKTRTSRTRAKPEQSIEKFISRTSQQRAKYRGGINMKSKGRESRVTSRSRSTDSKIKPKAKERRTSETIVKAKATESHGVWDSELTPEEEERVVAWVLDFKCQGFPLKMDILLDAIQNILNENPYKLRSFMDNRPSKEWYQAFLRHHPEVSAPVPTARQISREQERKRKASVTETSKKKAKQRKDSQADLSESECEDSGNAGMTDEEIDTNICSKCLEGYDDMPDNWIGCSCCERWFHKYCIHIDVAGFTNAEIEELDFKCEFCGGGGVT